MSEQAGVRCLHKCFGRSKIDTFNFKLHCLVQFLTLILRTIFLLLNPNVLSALNLTAHGACAPYTMSDGSKVVLFHAGKCRDPSGGNPTHCDKVYSASVNDLSWAPLANIPVGRSNSAMFNIHVSNTLLVVFSIGLDFPVFS